MNLLQSNKLRLFKKEDGKLLHNPIIEIRKGSNNYLWIISLILIILIIFFLLSSQLLFWSKYTNAIYGFSFEYPKSAKILHNNPVPIDFAFGERGYEIGVYADTMKQCHGPGMVFIQCSSLKDWIESSAWVPNVLSEYKELKVDDRVAYQRDNKAFILVGNKNNVYLIHSYLLHGTPKEVNSDNIYNHMLSTFKFIN